MDKINIVTELPGPKSTEMLARRDKAVIRGIGRASSLVVRRAHGATIEDVDGNTFLDFVSGIGTLNVGHTPKEVVKAMQEQAEKLIHLCALVGTYEPYVAVAELLNELVPITGPKKTLLANSGVEAVENAIKIARFHTGRRAIIAYEGAYHGRSLLGLSLTSKNKSFKKGFGPFVPDIHRVPFPNSYLYPHGTDGKSCSDGCIEDLERAFVAQVDPNDVAAVIIEPILGEGGFVPAPPEYLKRLRSICDEHGILLIADEVQSGFGRTGRWFAFEHAGIEPDIVTMAKSLAGGMPLSAVTGKAEVMDAPDPGGMGGTYGGNPLACVAALESIEFIKKNQLVARAKEIGDITLARYQSWVEKYEIVGDARGLGAMLAFELVSDKAKRTPNMDATGRIVKEAFKRGLLIIRAGLYGNCVRTLMPLTISDEQMKEGLDLLEAVVAKVNDEK
jgi:4-aminobutyrate aminotransferase / (S)-3-amino-2-methylpropionate transaminase / 5-aminovalerate transaminase